VAIVLAGACVAGTAWAQVETQVDTRPDWARKPSPEDLMAVWPHEMLKQGKGGKAAIRCKVNRLGSLFDCRVLSETPAGSGFGMAAIALTPQFLLTPARKGGVPVDYDGVNIPINFDGAGLSQLGDGAIGARKVVTLAHWNVAPTYAQVVAAYPAKARAKRLGGHATLSCSIKGDGHLGDCQILMSEPSGAGFSDAARSLAKLFVAPPLVGDQPTKGMLTQVAFTFAPEMLDAAAPLIGKPRWVALPTPQQMNEGLPSADAGSGVSSARVVLSCAVVEGGKVGGCAVSEETPAGKGYGAAALGVSRYFALSNWTLEGLPTVGGQVRIPIRYELTPTAPAPAAKP